VVVGWFVAQFLVQFRRNRSIRRIWRQFMAKIHVNVLNHRHLYVIIWRQIRVQITKFTNYVPVNHKYLNWIVIQTFQIQRILLFQGDI